MSGLESLYPFLYPSPGDSPGEGAAARDAAAERVLAEVASSTRAKVAEIDRLRLQVAREQAEQIAACAGAMVAAFAAGGRLFTFGNGGSSTDAQAVAAWFMTPDRSGAGLPALALTADVAVLTALSNDVSFDVVFARQIAASGRAGDIAFGLSTSGGSSNVLAGLAAARRIGMVTVGLAGGDGGRMAEPGTVDHLFVMPSSSVHRIQEAQTTVYQVLGELVRETLRSS
ncbi:SIS domain-containing protein [Actinomycetospora sp.]|uniref:D-sedoheptulose-7-phosphate isomerase n=1 Tax=Actinomycetospora sp. TaxID=1872135 RepID=UPI002F41CF70